MASTGLNPPSPYREKILAVAGGIAAAWLVWIAAHFLFGLTIGLCHIGDEPPSQLDPSAFRDVCTAYDDAVPYVGLIGAAAIVSSALLAGGGLIGSRRPFTVAAVVMAFDLLFVVTFVVGVWLA